MRRSMGEPDTGTAADERYGSSISNENGYRNSGVTLTYALEEDGSPDYTFTIHHKKINSMSETERGALSAKLARACNAGGNYSVSYEYLLTDF